MHFDLRVFSGQHAVPDCCHDRLQARESDDDPQHLAILVNFSSDLDHDSSKVPLLPVLNVELVPSCLQVLR